jgi:hypothetical protein
MTKIAAIALTAFIASAGAAAAQTFYLASVRIRTTPRGPTMAPPHTAPPHTAPSRTAPPLTPAPRPPITVDPDTPERPCSIGPAATVRGTVASRAGPFSPACASRTGAIKGAPATSGPLAFAAGAADRHVPGDERPILVDDQERDGKINVAFLLGDLHQDRCLNQAAIVDREAKR